MAVLSFRSGTLELSGFGKQENLPKALVWDARSGVFRAPALAYAEVVLGLRKQQLAFEDQARAYPELTQGLLVRREPRPFQVEALAAWDARIGEIYRELGAVALDLSRAQGEAGAEALERLQRLLAIPRR